MKQEIEIRTADGVAKAHLFTPDGMPKAGSPGVILYMDAFGLRPALDGMATRLADQGYIVLVPDLFYRAAPYGPFDTSAFSNEVSRKAIMALLHGTTQAMTASDSGAFIATLREHGASGRIGTVGYCFGGGRALTAAGTYPDEIAAAASLHGGNIASEAPDSPHRLAPSIKARVYVGNAGVDQSFPPEQSARLAEALREGGVDHVIENYVGLDHGWTVPDNGAFNETGAERHWKRLLNFFDETLG
jgi:carboxymethylenebutenolidase